MPVRKKTTKPIRILFVMESWGKGGTETYVAGLAKTLAKQGFDMNLALLRGPNPGPLSGLAPEKISVNDWIGLSRRIRKEKPDCLSLHLYTGLLPAVILGRLLGVPTISTLHIPLSAWGFRNRLYWRAAIRLSDLTAGVSNEVLDELSGVNILKMPRPGGIESLFFNKNKRTLNSRLFRILAVGRLEHQKDWPTLIKALGMIPGDIKKTIKVDFYGEGSQREVIKTLAKKQGVDVVFHGHVPKNILVSVMNQSNLSVLPSRFEGLGLSALESMAAGVPMITSDFIAAKDFIEEGETGNTFPIGDAIALSKLIIWHMQNRKKSSKLGEGGRQFVKKHFFEKTVFLPYSEIFERFSKKSVN